MLKSLRVLSKNCFWFKRGDVFTIDYCSNGYGYTFTGICIRVCKRFLLSVNTSFILRNVFTKIAVEVRFTLYGICRLNFRMLAFARKHFYYRSSKLYYLRIRSNKHSIIRAI